MIVLDTSVLVYAKGTGHPLRDPCRRLIEAIAEGAVQATTSVEVIQEFAHVRARRRGREDAAATASDYAELLSPLLPVTREHLQRGLVLFARNERLGAFDAVLAAAAVDSASTTLVSADVAFANVGEIVHVVPDDRGVETLLGL
jgi:predicted nucleic acid-binding protein